MLPSVLPTETDHVPVLADEVLAALALAARAGAAVITGKGPYSAQLDTRAG